MQQQQRKREQEQSSSMNESRSSAAARPTARTEPQREREPEQLQLVQEVTAEEATTWGRDAVDDVAGDGAVDGDTPCLLGIEHRQPREIE